MFCCDDYDTPAFYSEVWRKARKPHVCCECGKVINKGDTYEHISGKWEGTIQTYHTCEPCADLRASLGNVWCVPLECLQETYAEYLAMK